MENICFSDNQANIPSLDLGIAQQTSYLKDIDILEIRLKHNLEILTLRFLVRWMDEDLFNYMEIQNWIRGLGYPDEVESVERLMLSEDGKIKSTLFGQSGENIYSDATLQILSNSLIPLKIRNFK